jgi:hypothetical protein
MVESLSSLAWKGSGFRIKNQESWLSGARFRVQDLDLKIWSSDFNVQGLRFRVKVHV